MSAIEVIVIVPILNLNLNLNLFLIGTINAYSKYHVTKIESIKP